MKDWYIEDRNNEVYVLYEEKFFSKKKIYPDDGQKSPIEFFLLYNEDYKIVGYQLNYKWIDKNPKFLTYNSFGIIYNKKKTANVNLEVIFEDGNIRLLAYEHSSDVRDYFLVGRWRNSVRDEVVYG